MRIALTVLLVTLLTLAVACDSDQASEDTHAETQSDRNAGAAEAAGDPTGAPSTGESARAREEPAFDFRRVLVAPSTWVDSDKFCVVASVHPGALHEGDSLPTTPFATKLVRCAHPHGAYPVLVGIERAQASAPLEPFPRRARYDAVPERRLRLHIVGVSHDGHTPLTVLLSSSEAPGPSRPPHVSDDGRCLGCDEPGDEGPELPVGLDFGRVVREPGLAGTRGSCSVLVASEIAREGARATPTASLPEGAILTMPVTCHHAEGRSRATLIFTEDAAEQVLVVRRGAVVHGTVLLGSRLLVAHVVPATTEDD